jgi:DNA-binding transcriptional MerR regulator
MTLQELVDATGIPARTLRSRIELGLIPRAHGPGPKATYPHDALDRILRVRRLRQEEGASLDAIRQRIHDLTPETVPSRSEGSPTGSNAATVRATDPRAPKATARSPRRSADDADAFPVDAAPAHPPRSSATAPRPRTYTAFRLEPGVELLIHHPLTPNDLQTWEALAHRIRVLLQGARR